jgi:Rrf2 family transcriptional regulator, iron-sulfur cluster assembly transcription factor
MLNQSAEYALRATLYMAHSGAARAYKATAISDALNLPANYLSKIMHELVRARVLTSVRGPRGGYSLAIPPAKLTLDRIVGPFQDVEHRRACLMADRACDHAHPCAAHQQWEKLRDTLATQLRNTTLAAMLTPMNETSNPRTQTEVA